MKKFMKKTVSWVLTVAMVCPMIAQTLAFLPISFATEGATEITDPDQAIDGSWTNWDGWVLNPNSQDNRYIPKNSGADGNLDYDEIEAAVDYFKKYNTSTTDGTLSNMQYNTSTMYDYDALDFNLAMRQAELEAIRSGTLNTNSPAYQAGKWNGFYFMSIDDNKANDRDGSATVIGATQLDSFFRSVVAYDVAETTTDRVTIADGQYRLWNDRADAWMLDKDKSTSNAAEGVILTFKLNDGGYYTIQTQDGYYLSVEGADEALKFDLYAESPATHFYIYRRENGYYVLKTGEKNDNWFLNYQWIDEGAKKGRLISWKAELEEYPLEEDLGNAFQLERVTEIPIAEQAGSYQVILPDGRYTLGYGNENGFVKVADDNNSNNNKALGYVTITDDPNTDKDERTDADVFIFKQIGTTGTYTIENLAGEYLILGEKMGKKGTESNDGTAKFVKYLDNKLPPDLIKVEDDEYDEYDEYEVGQFVVIKSGTDYAIRSAVSIKDAEDNDKYCYLNNYKGEKQFCGYFTEKNGITDDSNNKFKLQSTNAQKFRYNAAANEYAKENNLLYGLNGKFLLRGDQLDGPFVWVNDAKQVVKNGGAVEWTITEDPANSGVYTLTTEIDGENYYLTFNDNNSVEVSKTKSEFQIYRAYADANGDGVADDANRIMLRAYPDNSAGYNAKALAIGSGEQQNLIVDPYQFLQMFDNGWNAFILYDLTMEDVSEFTYFTNYAQFNGYLGGGQNLYKGIMEKYLENGSPKLSSGIDYPIFGTEVVDGKAVYDNVQIPFIPVKSAYVEKNGDTTEELHTYTTYVFDSDLYSARFSNTDDAQLTAYANPQKILDIDEEQGGKTGWFPFNAASEVYSNQINNYVPKADYHFGTALSIPFTMTKNGRIGGIDDAPAIKFNFSGDDDVWVFIDGTLVLDLGGIHDKVDAEINFATNTWSLVDNNSGYINDDKTKPNDPKYVNADGTSGQIFKFAPRVGKDGNYIKDADGNYENQTYDDNYIFDASLGNFATGAHTLTIFYLERGESQSNCRITYNLPQKDTLQITKQVNYADSEAFTEEEKAAIADEEFEFVLYMGNTTDGIAENVTPAKGLTYQIYENRAPIDRIVRKLPDDGRFTLKAGQSAVFIFDNGIVDKGVTFQVEEIAEAGYSIAGYSYHGLTYEEYQIEGKNLVRPETPLEKYVSFSDTDTTTSADPLKSKKIYIKGSVDEAEELDFVCSNTYTGLSDVIVLDYGLGVDIDIGDLPSWKGSDGNSLGYDLSGIVIQNYHDTDNDGARDAQAKYGTVSTTAGTNETFELENGYNVDQKGPEINQNNSNGITWHGEVWYQTNDGENFNQDMIQNIGNDAESYVTVNYANTSGKDCWATIAIHYGTEWDRYMLVSVQETYSSEIVFCKSAGKWDTAKGIVYVTVKLKAGVNTIKLQGCDEYGNVGTGKNAPNLDKIVVDRLPDNAELTYQLTEQMTAVDVLKYTVTAAKGDATSRTTGLIYIVPATVMYYEENFKEAGTGNSNGNWINYVNGDNNFTNWDAVVSEDTTNKQEMGAVGVEGNHIYGSDDAYLNDAGDSNGTSMHVNTLTDKNTPAQFSYRFTGTGTTFFGRMGDNTGFMQVVITDSKGNTVYTYYRDTQYVDNNGSDTDKDVADGKLGVPMDFNPNGKKYFYGIPLFTWDTSDSNLDYGTYTVTVTIAKPLAVDDIGNDKINDRYVYGTEFWLDGIRVVNPLDMSPLTRAVEVMAVDEPVALADEGMTSRAIDNTVVIEAERVNVALGAYEADHETNPAISTVRDKILSDYEGAEGSWQLKSGLTGVDRSPVMPKAFTDIVSPLPGATEFKYYGPKEEVYLDSATDQSVTIYLPVAKLEANSRVHLGFKAPLADSELTIKVGNATNSTHYKVKNSTDCYYDITGLLTDKVGEDNKQQWYKITIEATNGLVSLTNIKVTEATDYNFAATNGTDSAA